MVIKTLLQQKDKVVMSEFFATMVVLLFSSLRRYTLVRVDIGLKHQTLMAMAIWMSLSLAQIWGRCRYGFVMPMEITQKTMCLRLENTPLGLR
jgi:hypothetical protein